MFYAQSVAFLVHVFVFLSRVHKPLHSVDELFPFPCTSHRLRPLIMRTSGNCDLITESAGWLVSDVRAGILLRENNTRCLTRSGPVFGSEINQKRMKTFFSIVYWISCITDRIKELIIVICIDNFSVVSTLRFGFLPRITIYCRKFSCTGRLLITKLLT